MNESILRSAARLLRRLSIDARRISRPEFIARGIILDEKAGIIVMARVDFSYRIRTPLYGIDINSMKLNDE